MPPRSKVTTLPADVRTEIERRMSDNGYGDYHKIAEWVRQQGYQISDDSVWRYGKGIQTQLEMAQMALYQATAIARIGGADKTVLMTALKTVVEQKVLTKLIEGEPVDNSDMRLMNRSPTCFEHRWFISGGSMTSRRGRTGQGLATAQTSAREGISEEAYYAMRNILLGRPFAQKHSSAPMPAGQTRDDFESQPQFDAGFDDERPDSTSKEEGEAGHIRDGDANVATPGDPLPPGVLRRAQAKADGLQIVRIDGDAGSRDSAQSNSPQASSPQPKAWVWPILILPGPKYQSDRPARPKPDT